jgi:phosphate transport system substrate-binding protein
MNDPRKNLELSRALKRALLAVRKSVRKFGSIELPGLFDVACGTRDSLLFLIAIFLEIYGLYNLRLVGDIQLMAAAGLFALDIVAGLMWHCGQSRRTELANRLAVTTDPAERAALKAAYPMSFTFVRLVGLLAIVGLAGFKMLTFISFAGGDTPLGVVLLIAVTYAVVGVIHVLISGYFLALAVFQIARLIEQLRNLRHKPFKDAPNYVKGHRHHVFESKVELQNTALGKHSLGLVRVKNGAFVYDLATWGILLDSELAELILQQPLHQQRAIVGDEGLRAQMEILESDPVVEPSGNDSKPLAPKNSIVLREVSSIAALVLTCGLISCADRKPSADTLDRVPVTVFVGEPKGMEELRAFLLGLLPEHPMVTDEGRRLAIPALTVVTPGIGGEAVVTVVDARAEATWLDQVWGRQPEPAEHLKELKERVMGLNPAPLVAPPTAPSPPYETTLIEQIEIAASESGDTIQPLVVYWKQDEKIAPDEVESARPEGVVLKTSAEWIEFLATTLSKGIQPIYIVFDDETGESQPVPNNPVEKSEAEAIEMPQPKKPVPPVRRLFTVKGTPGTRGAVVKTVEGYLRREGLSSVVIQNDDSGDGVTVRGIDHDNSILEIRIEPGEIDAGGGIDLQCDVAMGVAGENSGLDGTWNEHVLGITPVVIGVHPVNSLREVTFEQVTGILSGAVTDWRQLAVGHGPMRVLFPEGEEGSKMEALFRRRLNGLQDMANVQRLPAGEIGAAIRSDASAIGFLPMNRAGASIQVLRIAADELAPSIAPDASAVARDDYPFSQLSCLYTRNGKDRHQDQQAAASRYVRYATLDPEGQALVAEAGLFSQQLRFQPWEERLLIMRRGTDGVAQSEERRLRELVGDGAEQASITLRFGFNETELNARSQANLERLAQLLKSSEYAGSRLILIGFSDGVGSETSCQIISQSRAEAVGRQMEIQFGLTAEVAVGFGKLLPVDTNLTEEGRAKNRRVEVWLKRQDNIVSQSHQHPDPEE